jgi:hypothetical protein
METHSHAGGEKAVDWVSNRRSEEQNTAVPVSWTGKRSLLKYFKTRLLPRRKHFPSPLPKRSWVWRGRKTKQTPQAHCGLKSRKRLGWPRETWRHCNIVCTWKLWHDTLLNGALRTNGSWWPVPGLTLNKYMDIDVVRLGRNAVWTFGRYQRFGGRYYLCLQG